MAQHDLIELFDRCVDRLSEGESIESILADYPQQADELRDLLETSLLVYQVQQTQVSLNTDEINRAKASTRTRLTDLIADTAPSSPDTLNNGKVIPMKAKRTPRRWFPAAVAAVVALFVGVGIGIVGMSLNQASPIDTTRTSIASLNSTTTGLLTETVVAYSTQRAGSVVTMTPPPSATPIAVAGPDEVREAVVMVTETARMTATPMPTMPPTATITSTGDAGAVPVFMTATALAYEMLSETATAADGRPVGASGMDGSGGIVPTSVASMSTGAPPVNLTPTPVPDYSQVQLNPLRAGEIDDNAEWDRYMEYRRNFLSQFGNQVIDIDVRNRQIIQVIDSQNLPVQGALVQIRVNDNLVTESRTYATGMTQFFPKLYAAYETVDVFDVIVTKDNIHAEARLDLTKPGDVLTVELDMQQQSRIPALDVLFLIDTTSSMGDEIEELQNNITVIAEQVNDLSQEVDTRYGLVAYNDHNEQWDLIQTQDFTPDVRQFQTVLNSLEARSYENVDWQEAVNEGLYTAINEMSWRDDDTVKLVFLVGDARPHLDHPEEDHIYTEETLNALAAGIKIHPIASSGLQPAGEFIFRQIAQVTMGHFVFLTYDGGAVAVTGAPPGDTRDDLEVGDPQDTQGSGDYSVSQLDELILRLITDELAALNQEA